MGVADGINVGDADVGKYDTMGCVLGEEVGRAEGDDDAIGITLGNDEGLRVGL